MGKNRSGKSPTRAKSPAPSESKSAPAPQAAAAQNSMCSSVTSAPSDLTRRVAPYMDLHMMIPLLDFLDANNIYSSEDLARAKNDLLERTKINSNSADIASTEAALREAAQPFLAVHSKEALTAMEAAGQLNAVYLAEAHSLSPPVLEAVYAYAKFMYDRGQYATAAPLLNAYHKIHANSPGLMAGLEPAQLQAALAKQLDAQWGRLACALLLRDSAAALPALLALKESIDNDGSTPPLMLLQRRSWLLHWAMVALLALPSSSPAAAASSMAQLVELFFEPRYLETVQSACPWLLRYLAAGVVVCKRRRSTLKDLVRVLGQEQYTYSDAITELLDSLYNQFDFEAAQACLLRCDALLQQDYFLRQHRAAFLEAARLFIFETYCRIHQEVDIGMLAARLQLGPEEAERWAVDLVRGARLSARINVTAAGGANGTVVMDTRSPSVYQQVIARTKNLTARSFALVNNLERVTREQVSAATMVPAAVAAALAEGAAPSSAGAGAVGAPPGGGWAAVAAAGGASKGSRR